MEHLTFDRLLRNALPGGLCIVTALLVFRSHIPLPSRESAGVFDATVLLGLALLIGTLLQSLHRAFFYPILVRFIHRRVSRKTGLVVDENALQNSKGCEQFVLCRLTEMDVVSFDRIRAARKEDEKLEKWLSGWADKTHFLWASFYAIVTGTLVPAIEFGWPADAGMAFFAAAVLLAVAYLDDCRLMHYQLHVVCKPRTGSE